ncbi:hypothetical protein MTO96_036835 [Rhipicephalus appendiculatus]
MPLLPKVSVYILLRAAIRRNALDRYFAEDSSSAPISHSAAYVYPASLEEEEKATAMPHLPRPPTDGAIVAIRSSLARRPRDPVPQENRLACSRVGLLSSVESEKRCGRATSEMDGAVL